MPVFGCSPRPLNKPGGSILKFPTFSFLPSKRHVLYLSSTLSRSAFNAFFCAVVSSFFLAFSASRYAKIGVKSHLSKSLMFVPSS